MRGLFFGGLICGLTASDECPESEVPGRLVDTPNAPLALPLVTLDADDFEVGLFGVVISGVSALCNLLLAYGSAVAGRGISAFLGRRTGADISPPGPVFEVVDVFGGLDDVVDLDGGGALLVDDVFDTMRFEDTTACLTGESAAMAEPGLSGRRLAVRRAFFCAAICSLSVERIADAAALGFTAPTPTLAVNADDFIAFGFEASFSRSCLDFASRVSMIL